MKVDTLDTYIFKKARQFHLKRKFYAYVSGAQYKKTIEIEKSGKSIESDFFSNNFLLDLKRIGNIGFKIDNSRIGYCAEIRAVNLVSHKRKIHKYKEICVGIAIRPRTMQKGKKCNVCKTIF